MYKNGSYVQIRWMHSYKNSCILFKKAKYFYIVCAVTVTQRYVIMNKKGADSQPLPLDRRCACPVSNKRPVRIKEILRSIIQCLFGQYFLVIVLLKMGVKERSCVINYFPEFYLRGVKDRTLIKRQLLSLHTLHIISYLQLFLLDRIWL